MTRFYKNFAALIGLFFVLIAVFNVNEINANENSISQDLLDQIRLEILTSLTQAEMNRFVMSVDDFQVQGAWVFGMYVIRAGEAHSSPEIRLVIARQTVNEWQISLEYTEPFYNLLNSLPADMISLEAKQNLQAMNPSLSNLESQAIQPVLDGNGEAQLSMPFASGETWRFTGGPHNSAGADARPWSAIDFSAGSGQVRAAREGTVVRTTTCLNFIRVDHADGWQTGYYHLSNEQVPNGASVSRGQHIGDTSTNVGCGGSATGPHVHFSLRRNGGHENVGGHDIGGFTIEDGSAQYNGCILHIQTNARTCQWGYFTYDGAIGSGTPLSYDHQGRLYWDQVNTRTINSNRPHRWHYWLDTTYEYRFEIRRTSGNLQYNVVLKHADGRILASSGSSPDGGINFHY